MEFQGFEREDFEVFQVPGLEARMEVLKRYLRVKLSQLGEDFSRYLTELCGEPMFAHVARHARRTVNPPKDSWVAFAADKRGYKKHPHFQIGAWESHAFATVGIIWESPSKKVFGEQLKRHLDEVVRVVPKAYVYIPDHTSPDSVLAADVSDAQLKEFAERLISVKQGELLVGLKLSKGEAIKLSPDEFEEEVKACFKTLLPLYRLAKAEGAYQA